MSLNYEKKRAELLAVVQKKKNLILENNEAIRKASRRTRGTHQQIEEVLRTLRSMKSRLSALRDMSNIKQKENLRNLKTSCEAFKTKQGLEVVCFFLQSSLSSHISLEFDPGFCHVYFFQFHRINVIIVKQPATHEFLSFQERRIRIRVEKESASDNKNRAELQALLQSFQSDL